MDERRISFLSKIGEMSRGIMERAFTGQASALGAIKAKCLDCCHFDRDEVANCTTVLCALHEYRPFAETVVSERRKTSFKLSGRPARGARNETTILGNG